MRLNRFLYSLVVIVLLSFMGCASARGGADPEQAVYAAESALASMGSGENIEPSSKSLIPSIAFERPRPRGLSTEEMWIPDTIRSAISQNFTNFGRGYITVINIADDDARSAEIQRSLSGSNDELSLVARTAARSIMTGTIIKISGTNRFNLELIITETETSTVLASHRNTYSDAEQAVRRATEDLLTQIGLRLSDAGRQRLYQTSSEADIALARGRNAEREGQNLQAMNYLFNAQNFASTASQASVSLAAVQTTQQSLGAGSAIIDHFARQEFFQSRLNEYNSFYESHAPFELFYTEPRGVNMKGTKTDAADTRQFDLDFKVGLRWNQNQISVMEKVLNDYILTRLNTIPAAQRNTLELQGLPENSRLFGGPDNFNYNLVISVENENGVPITSGSLDLSASLFYHNGRIYARCIQEKDAVLPNIKYVENQFRELYVVITSINGVDVRTVGESGFMRLVQVQGAGLPPPNRDNLPWQLTNRLSSDVERSASEEKRRERERKAEERKTARESEMATHPMNTFFYGYDINGGWLMGTGAGSVGLGLVGGYKGLSAEFGISFYPGLEKERMKEYMGAVNDISTIGIDIAGLYSFVYPKWHVSLGGGVTMVYTWESGNSGSTSSSSSSSSETRMEAVPNFQTWFNWRFFQLMFLKVGYKGDFYPGIYRDFFTNAGPAEGRFWGHRLIFGVSMVL